VKTVRDSECDEAGETLLRHSALSPYEMRDRVVLFLGAGASAPLSIPTSKEFIPRFLEASPQFSNMWLGIESRLSKSGYSQPIDLEAAMTVLDALSSVDPIAYLEDAAGAAPFFFFQSDFASSIEKISLDYGQQSNKMAEALRLFVRQKCERPDFSKIRIYDSLMSAIGEGPWNIPDRGNYSFTMRGTPRFNIPDFYCFTTNYDLAFERYCRRELKIQVKTGFRDEQGEVTLSRHDLLNHDVPFGVLHLHGSVEMLRVSDGNIIPTPTYPKGMTITSRGEEIEGEAMIYPVLEKQLSRFPFPEVFSAMYEQLRESPLAVFVGFSFRDLPIVRLLQDASHRDQKIVIVSNTAREIANTLRPKLRGQVIAAPGRIGQPNLKEIIAGVRNE